MRASCRIHVEVPRDIDECMTIIASDNPIAAARFRDAAKEAIEMIADFPRAGAFHQALEPDARGLRKHLIPGFGSYIVIYRILDRESVEILGVLHTSRDLPAVFGRR